MKTKHSSPFLQQFGHEVTASSTIRVCDASVLLFFSFSFPPLHTCSETIELDNVYQAIDILKITGWFGSTGRPFLFRVQCAYSKQAFQLSIKIFRPEMKARTLLSTPPLCRLGLTWESLKVMLVNQRQQWSCLSTFHFHGIFMTEKVRQGSAKKNKLQIWSGYLVNHDNIVQLNKHFFHKLHLPAILCSFSQLLKVTQHLCQLPTEMSGTFAKAL